MCLEGMGEITISWKYIPYIPLFNRIIQYRTMFKGCCDWVFHRIFSTTLCNTLNKRKVCKASKAWYQRLFDTLQNNGTIKDEWVETVLSSKAQQYNMERQCLVMVVTSNLCIICITVGEAKYKNTNGNEYDRDISYPTKQ